MTASWTSSDNTIADIDSDGVAAAVGVGKAFITGAWDTERFFEDLSGGCDSTPIRARDMVSMIVRPKVTSITPSRGGVGSTTSVTINGSGFSSGATVSAGAGISVSVVSVTSTKIVADFTIAANAMGGNRNVTVSAVRGPASTPKNFFVQIPTKASAAISSIVIREPNPGDFVNGYNQTIRTNVCGAYRNITYTLLDQASQPIHQELTVTEVLTDFAASNPGVPQPEAFSAPTTDQGIFVDFLAVAYAPPCDVPPFSFTVKQAFKVTVEQSTYDLTTKNTISVSKTAPAQWTITLTNTTP